MNQNVTATKKYDAYGNTLGSTGSWVGRYGYSGQFGYQDDGDDLQLLGHRYYDSNTGTFITRDPIKDGRNWYSYCDNNPITRVDANGLDWFDDLSNFMAGWGDNLTMGGTAKVRDWIGVDIVDTNSPSYRGGDALGTAHGFFLPSPGGKMVAIAGVTGSVVKAVAKKISSFIGAHVAKKFAKRGWTKMMIYKLVKKSKRTRKTKDTRRIKGGGNMNEDATVYYDETGNYVVRNDRTGEIIQVSDRTDPNWVDPLGGLLRCQISQ